MKKALHILNKIDEDFNGIMFFGWMIIVPFYFFFFNQIDFTERVFHISLVAFPYMASSIFKTFTNNIKFESAMKIIAYITYWIVLVRYFDFNGLISSPHILMIGYGILLVIASINVIVNMLSSVLRLFIVNKQTI